MKVLHSKYDQELVLIDDIVQKEAEKINHHFEIFKKQGEDLVTTFDLAIEKAIINMIHQHYPNDQILSEESYFDTRLTKRTWIIDPIDGTTNFSSHFPLYCIQVALYDQGDIVLAYLYIPTLSKTYYAIKDCGAFLNDEPIHVTKKPDLKNGLFALIGAFNDRESIKKNFYALIQIAQNNKTKMRMVGSCGVELAFVAEGIYIGCYTQIKNIWDIAPGYLLAKEAGALISDFDFRTFELGKTNLLVCANDAIKKSIIKGLSDIV